MRAGRRGVVAFMAAVLAGAALAAVGSAAPVSAQTRGLIRGAVTDGVGPVDGVAVDLFTADDDGNRAEWLTSTRTSEDGYEFEVDPGCYTVTFIAPFDQTFANGSRWVTAGACVAAGGVENIDAVLGPAPPEQVSGVVLNENGGWIDGITVDLFTATGNGERGRYLRSAVTGRTDSGLGFAFTVDPGCYVLTFISNDERRFVESGTAWLNVPFCVEHGAVPTPYFQVTLRYTEGVVLTVGVEQYGLPVEGVAIDLFVSGFERGSYVASARTDASGKATFSPDPGCYILTYIAPAGDVWFGTDTPWRDSAVVCLENGSRINLFPQRLADRPPLPLSLVSAAVSQEGVTLPGIVIDVFEAGPDGSRGRFDTDIVTQQDRPTEFNVLPGCWYLTFIAPEGDTFAESGTRWLNRSFCTGPEPDSFDFDVQLNPRPSRVELVEIADTPFRSRGQVDATSGVDYVVTGEPGSQIALEVLEMSGVRPPPCDYDGLTLVIKTSTEVRRSPFPFTCQGSAIGWTIPADGTLVFGFRSISGEARSFEVFIGKVDDEEVDVPLSPGSTQEVSGTISIPGDGINYVVRGEPGQPVSIHRQDSTCRSMDPRIRVAFRNAQGNTLSGFEGSCGAFGPVEIPADGVLYLWLKHLGGPAAAQPLPYALSFTMIAYDTVTVAPGPAPVEFTGESDAPFDGVDYVFEATTFDRLRVTLLEPVANELCLTTLLVTVRAWADDRPLGSANSTCAGLTWTINDVADATTIRVRVMGYGPPPAEPAVPFRVRFEQLP